MLRAIKIVDIQGTDNFVDVDLSIKIPIEFQYENEIVSPLIQVTYYKDEQTGIIYNSRIQLLDEGFPVYYTFSKEEEEQILSLIDAGTIDKITELLS